MKWMINSKQQQQQQQQQNWLKQIIKCPLFDQLIMLALTSSVDKRWPPWGPKNEGYR